MAISSFFINRPWRGKKPWPPYVKNAMQPPENMYSIAAAASSQAEEDSLQPLKLDPWINNSDMDGMDKAVVSATVQHVCLLLLSF
jgi:hypothetical protein